MGETVDQLLESIADRTPGVISFVSAMLPKDFPAYAAETIFQGLEQTAKKLKQG